MTEVEVPAPASPSLQLRDWCLAALTAPLLTLAQPPIGLGFVAWVTFLPLLLALDRKSPAQGCLLGFFSGMLCSWCVVGRWLVFSFEQVPLDFLTSTLLTQGTIGVSGVIGFVIFGLVCRDWASTRLASIWVPASWVAIEYLRTNMVAGTPWCLLGFTQSPIPLFIQVADLTGVYGVSFLVCMVNVAVASTWLGGARRRRSLIVSGVLMAASTVYGWVRLQQVDPGAASITIQVAHPAWPRGLGEAPLQRLEDLIRISDEEPPSSGGLLIWPENALRFDLQSDSDLSETFVSFVQRRRQYVIAGLHRFERNSGGTHYFNSAVLMAPEGSILGVADKRYLLPIAEARWPLLPAVEPSFSRGRDWLPLAAGQKKIGVLMCFESIFPEPARHLAQQGVSILVNPANDEILSAGAHQLAAMAVFRSVENRMPLVHAGTSGITQIIDSRGRVVDSESTGPRLVSATVTHAPGGTWYTHHGDVFARGCWLVMLLQVLATIRGERKRLS